MDEREPEGASGAPEPDPDAEPRTAEPGEAVPGYPQPPDVERARDLGRDPHGELNTPVGEPSADEWPDPYERRSDPRDPEDPDGAPFGEQPHPPTGSQSTSEPHPDQDPDAEAAAEKLRRDKLDD